MAHYPFFYTWYCGIMVMLYLADVSPQHIHQGMKKYDVIGLMNLYWINSSDKIIRNSICTIFWSIVCMVSIKEDIITNTPFWYSGEVFPETWILVIPGKSF